MASVHAHGRLVDSIDNYRDRHDLPKTLNREEACSTCRCHCGCYVKVGASGRFKCPVSVSHSLYI